MTRRTALHLLLLLAVVLVGYRLLRAPMTVPTPITSSSPTVPWKASATPAPPVVVPGTVLEAPSPPAPPPLRGDQVLVLAGSPDGPLTLDPALVQDVDSAFVVQQLFRGIVRFDPQLRVVPEFAERIEISPDGATYTVRLRPDATFHDGTPITAGDVKYSWERACDPALAGGDGRRLPAWSALRDLVGAEDRLLGRRDDVPGIEAVDARTLRLRLAVPSPTFLARLALPVASVVQRADVERGPDWWRQPVGSGPFRLLRWDDDALVLGPHPGYRPAPPYLREVRIRIGAAALSPLNQYERGQLDVASVPVWAVDRVSAPESPYRDQLVVQPLLAGTYVFLNPAVPPLDDPQVRRALVQAFPSRKVAEVTLLGKVPAADALVPESMPGGPWRAKLLPEDPAAAQRVLAGRELHLEIVSSGGDVAVMLARVWEERLGVDTEVLQLDWPDYLADLDARSLPVFVLSWVADYPDSEAILDALFALDSPHRPIAYENRQVQAWLEAARRTRDPQARHAALRAAQQAILDDAVVLPLTFDVEYLLVAPAVRDFPVTPLGILGLERVWIDRSASAP
ncbi:MAG: peptide ABC transporter substrate-binding protein [Thermomicrobium sp.]|nr:peptide ABC transporter substrate-binding protein [Thermomicrobium sp.]